MLLTSDAESKRLDIRFRVNDNVLCSVYYAAGPHDNGDYVIKYYVQMRVCEHGDVVFRYLPPRDTITYVSAPSIDEAVAKFVRITKSYHRGYTRADVRLRSMNY